MKLLVPFVLFFTLLACNADDSEESAYQEILEREPFSLYTDSIRDSPDKSELYFQRAVLLNKNNLPEPALADFMKAWSLDQQERYALGAGNMLLETKPDSAAVFLKQAGQKFPESIFLPLLEARAYDATGKTDDALAACEKILSVEPQQVNALLLKAELMEKKNDPLAMIAALEQAHRALPNNLEISNKLAYQYAETKNPKALLLADTLIRQDTLKMHPEFYYIKGNYYANIDNKAKAIELFDQTIRLDHRYLNAYIEKGKIQLSQKKTTDALQTFQLVNRIKPDFPDAWYWIGACLEILGQKKEAKENYEKAFGLDKTFTIAKEAADKL